MNKNNNNNKPAEGAQSAERLTVKIYTENTFDGTGSHRALAEFHDCEGEGEKDAALKMLEKYIQNHKGGYAPKVVEVGGCRRVPGAGRIYFFDGKNPLENYEPNSQGKLCV